VLCDVAQVVPDAATVDGLARFVLTARRHGSRVRFCNASPELAELIDFMGLTRALLPVSVEAGG
jgi:anti-anti-sigma regulatory factor